MNRSDPDQSTHNKPIHRVLVMMPAGLEAAVAATAFLSAFRSAHPEAHVTVLVKRRLRPVLSGLDSVDRVLSIRKRPARRGRGAGGTRRRSDSLLRLGRRLSRGGFDTAIILPAGFKAAALAAVAGIPQRIGYEREGRGVILTDRLVQRKHRGAWVPVALDEHYLGIARYLGAAGPAPNVQLRVSPAEQQRLDRVLREQVPARPAASLLVVDLDASDDPLTTALPIVLEHATDAADSTTPVLLGSRDACEAMQAQLAEHGITTITLQQGIDPGLLKPLVARSRCVLSHDPGLRALAQAFDRPCIALSGNTRAARRAPDHEHAASPPVEGVS